jgi:acetylornithine/succinyldiaminopimelate/putrescine aminotransferase
MLSDGAITLTLSPAAGTTFGGNPLVAASALYVMERMTDPSFLPEVQSKGALMLSELKALAAKHPNLIKEVRHPPTDALWAGVELTFPAQTVIDRAVDAGLLVISAGTNTLRICPPLTIDEDELRQGLQTLGTCITGQGMSL